MAILLAGCDRPPTLGTETIVFDMTPSFCFTCKSFAIRLRPEGRGEFVGNDAVARPRGRFLASPAQVRAFAERLAPYRPKGTRSLARLGRQCGVYVHDGTTIDVRWSGGDGGKPAHLIV